MNRRQRIQQRIRETSRLATGQARRKPAEPPRERDDNPADLEQIRQANLRLLLANVRFSAERLRRALDGPARKMTPGERKLWRALVSLRDFPRRARR